MLVILPPEAYEGWLGGEANPADLIHPYAAEADDNMATWGRNRTRAVRLSQTLFATDLTACSFLWMTSPSRLNYLPTSDGFPHPLFYGLCSYYP